MLCKRCGEVIPDKSRTCPVCGVDYKKKSLKESKKDSFDRLKDAMNGLVDNSERNEKLKRAAEPVYNYYWWQIMNSTMFLLGMLLLFLGMIKMNVVFAYCSVAAFVILGCMCIATYRSIFNLAAYSDHFDRAGALFIWSRSILPSRYHLCAGFGEITTTVDPDLSDAWGRAFVIDICLLVGGVIFMIIGAEFLSKGMTIKLVLGIISLCCLVVREVRYVNLIGRTAGALACDI